MFVSLRIIKWRERADQRHEREQEIARALLVCGR
jgi:hypothetical protein